MSRAKLNAYLETSLPRTTPAMRRAILAIQCDQATWREAAIRYKVTESGILKAMQRGKVREFLAGTGQPS